MATCTANQLVQYNSVAFGKTYSEWVDKAHAYNCSQNGWKCAPLKPGAYGYDNIVMSLHKVFSEPNFERSVEDISRLIHDGWAENYRYWVDVKPYKTDDKYIKPSKPINDKRRNECAVTPYKDLPEDEQEKDRVFARFVLQNL
jgi:hypothetical protein